MKRAVLVALVVLAGCSKKSDVPKLRLDSGPTDQPRADAAPPAPDAALAAAAAPVPQKLAVSDGASCALMSDATVRCWDLGGSGSPTDPKLRGVKDLVASQGFACALLDDGSVTCWGAIGFGDSAKTPKPMGAPGVTKATRVFAAGGAACAQTGDGVLACWGDVDPRGHVTASGAHRVPTAVVGADHIIAMTERAALRENGDLVYFGDGGVKKLELGDGKELASEGDVACVRRGDGTVGCIGGHPLCAAAQKAPPKPVKPLPPPKGAKTGRGAKGKKVPVAAPPPPPAEPKLALEALPFGKTLHLALDLGEPCAVTAAHKVVCADATDPCKPPVATPIGNADLVAGRCALSPRGTVACWGGDRKPVAIAGVANITQLAGAPAQACALDKEHHVWCWKATGPAASVDFAAR